MLTGGEKSHARPVKGLPVLKTDVSASTALMKIVSERPTRLTVPLAFTHPGPGAPHFTQGAASLHFVVSQGLARKDSLTRKQQSSWQYVARLLQPAMMCYPEPLVENSKIQFNSTGPVQLPN